MHTVTIHPLDRDDHRDEVPCDVPGCSNLAAFRITSTTDAVRFGCSSHHGAVAGNLVRSINRVDVSPPFDSGERDLR